MPRSGRAMNAKTPDVTPEKKEKKDEGTIKQTCIVGGKKGKGDGMQSRSGRHMPPQCY